MAIGSVMILSLKTLARSAKYETDAVSVNNTYCKQLATACYCKMVKTHNVELKITTRLIGLNAWSCCSWPDKISNMQHYHFVL